MSDSMDSSARRSIPAVVLAGDGEAAKMVQGQSKAFLPVGGQPLVTHAVLALQRVPEISEVWVVGNAVALEKVFTAPAVAESLRKPLHILEQYRNLYENAWESYRKLLPGAGQAGRDPAATDLDTQVLYLSGDLPFPTPEEIALFVRKGIALKVDHVFGLVPESSLREFLPKANRKGIRPAYYNVREGRFRQSNLHLAKPARIGNREAIGEIYRLRYQRNPLNILRVALSLLGQPRGSLGLLALFFRVHLAGFVNRLGLRTVADVLRRFNRVDRIEAALSRVLGGSLRFVVTEVGGCAIDIDTDREYKVVCARYDEWRAAQDRRVAHLGLPRLLAAASEDREELRC